MRLSGMRLPAFLLLILALLCACGRPSDSGRKVVAVSFPTQAALLEEIAGDDFDIVTLLPAGSDPETYQPSVSTMKAVGKADAYLTLGTQGFEENLTASIRSNFPGVKIIDCTEGVAKLTDSHALPGEGIHSAGSAFDPHIMASIRNSAIIAGNMGKIMSRLYPEDSERLASNSCRVEARLHALDSTIAAMPIGGKAFVIRHPSLSYFARDYGLEQIALSDVSKETSPRRLKARLEQASAGMPAAFIIEREHANAADTETAKQLGLAELEVSLNSKDWISDLKRIAHEIDRD